MFQLEQGISRASCFHVSERARACTAIAGSGKDPRAEIPPASMELGESLHPCAEIPPKSTDNITWLESLVR